MIISQTALRVNRADLTANKHVAQKWEDKHTQTQRMAYKLARTGYKSRAERMYNCGEVLIMTTCEDCGNKHVERATLCRDKLCPTCAWRLSVQRYKAMSTIVTMLRHAYPEYDWYYTTFTCKNCDVAQLRDTMLKMSRALTLTFKRRSVAAVCAGYARVAEITYNAVTRQMHPHYHIIMMLKPGASSPKQITTCWLGATQDVGLRTSDQAQDIQMIHNKGDTQSSPEIKALLETYKYSVKTTDMERMPDDIFAEFVAQVNGMRMTAFGGLIKEYKIASELDMEDVDYDDKSDVCTECGNTHMRRSILRWSTTEAQYIEVTDRLPQDIVDSVDK